MNKKRCPLCGAVKTKKNCTRKGVQLYKCLVCRHQFRSGFPSPATEIWNAYQNDKQTICQIAEQNHLSTSSVKRRLRKIEICLDAAGFERTNRICPFGCNLLGAQSGCDVGIG